MKATIDTVRHALFIGTLFASAVSTAACGDEDAPPEAGDTESDTTPAPPTDPQAHCPGDLDKTADGYACIVEGIIDELGRGVLTEESVDSPDALVWVPGITYILGGIIVIDGDSTLTIEPGSRILGDPEAADVSPAALFINNGSKLHAVGTPEKPIVFTSAAPAGERQAGDWGGIKFSGVACSGDSMGSSGTLAYLQIQFAGRKQVKSEQSAASINGVTLSCVGAGTEIHHLHVHRSADSGIFVDGGTVNLHHLLITGAADRGFGWEGGWRGRARFGIVSDVDGAAASYGIWGQNSQGTGNEPDRKPRSAPTLYNFTIAGPGNEGTAALLLAYGTAGTLANLLVGEKAEYDACIDIEGEHAWQQTIGDLLSISGSILPDRSDCFPTEDATGYFEEDWWNDGQGNRMADVSLKASTDGAPAFVPETEAALSGGVDGPAGMAFFENVSFVGAMGEEDWTAGWTAFPEN